nr:MAG TPA: hypothetical protein [Caudoviricetes sp.]
MNRPVGFWPTGRFIALGSLCLVRVVNSGKIWATGR